MRETDGGRGEEEEGVACPGGRVGIDEAELKMGLGGRWKGSRMFRNAERPWTGPLCWAWSRK